MADCCFFVLMVLLTFFLWVTWLNNIATANQGGCGQIRYLKFLEPEKGHYLEGHVFLNLSIGARRSCEEECLYQRECVAINVGPRIKEMVVCELCNSDHFQHQKDLKLRHGWTYRGTENVCASKPCFNNGKCFLGYTDKRYICDCQAGYTGENCEKDIDECSNGYHNCHENATCINIPGSFNCSCKPGYIGDGRVCSVPAECKTWRTKDGGCCVFPFRYRGKLRDSCVFEGELWCSVTKNYDIDKLRGACEDFNFAFTTLGTQGLRGPTDTSGYQGTTLQYKILLDKGIQIWKVPLNGSYVIEAWGASGAKGRETIDPSLSSRAGGKGAYMKGSFNLTHGMLLKILVGQTGSVGTTGSPFPGGGGGGTFVILSSGGALIVAGGGGGGGGGAPSTEYDEGDPGQITENGSQYGGSNGDGGSLFVEDNPHASFEAGAGGGLTGDGQSSVLAKGGKSFENSGKGGTSPSGANGGFGGGGGGSKFPGAGGGYSGGGVLKKTGGKTIAGGGGSLNSGINQEKKQGVNGGDGKVVITLVKPTV